MSDYADQARAEKQWRRALRHGSRKIKVVARRAGGLDPVAAVIAVRQARATSGSF
jgi:hypothetical protein